MKSRVLLITMLLGMLSFGVSTSCKAQKFALLDMEYILKNIPAYERANEQLNQVSKKWQAEVEALNLEASTMYKNYQNEVVFLSQEQKKAKQEAIMQKEKEASELKKKYFGPEGLPYYARRRIESGSWTSVRLLLRCKSERQTQKSNALVFPRRNYSRSSLHSCLPLIQPPARFHLPAGQRTD